MSNVIQIGAGLCLVLFLAAAANMIVEDFYHFYPLLLMATYALGGGFYVYRNAEPSSPLAIKDPKQALPKFAWTLVIILMLIPYGFIADFVPSRVTVLVSILLASISALGAAMIFESIVRLPGSTTLRALRTTRRRRGAVYYGALFVFLLAWIVFGHSLPAIYTRLTGENVAVVATLGKTSTRETPGGLQCRYRVYGQLVRGAFPDHACISRSDYRAMEKAATFQLEGRQGPLGTVFTTIALSKDTSALSERGACL